MHRPDQLDHSLLPGPLFGPFRPMLTDLLTEQLRTDILVGWLDPTSQQLGHIILIDTARLGNLAIAAIQLSP
jgi:hypothetical protein